MTALKKTSTKKGDSLSSADTLSVATATDEEILAEVGKIQYLYRMKRVIRWHTPREEEYDTESVAEHVYGMFILAEYFLPYEDKDNEWDRQKIYQMMLFHDIDEIETGDTLGYLKTPADQANEAFAMQRVIEHVPASMQADIRRLSEEYSIRQTVEAKFVKAIDKIEPSFQIFNEGGKEILHKNKTTKDAHSRIKHPYVDEFPTVQRFNEVLTNNMARQDFFVK